MDFYSSVQLDFTINRNFPDLSNEGCQNLLAGFLEEVLKSLCFPYAIRLLSENRVGGA